jgi:hypothetical protein
MTFFLKRKTIGKASRDISSATKYTLKVKSFLFVIEVNIKEALLELQKVKIIYANLINRKLRCSE